MSGLSDASAFDAFNRMAEKIEESERRTIALTEVDEALHLPDIEREFLQLEASKGGADMDDRLVALKQQMGVLPPPAPKEEPRQLGAGMNQGNAQVQDGEVEIEEDEGGTGSGEQETVAEAELLRQFERLEQRDSR
jgi:phage shock protein A